jgi:hypothetical protein
MRNVMKTVAIGFAAAATLSLGAAATATAATTPAGGTYEGCDYGAVCIYPGASWSGTPIEFYSYGAHNLTNETGVHRVFNNQYNGAIARTCTGYNGAGCQGVLAEYTYEDVNLTPINSVLLAAS